MKAGVLGWVVFTVSRVGCVVCVPVSLAYERVWVLGVVTARSFFEQTSRKLPLFFFT